MELGLQKNAETDGENMRAERYTDPDGYHWWRSAAEENYRKAGKYMIAERIRFAVASAASIGFS